jgi:hypothetical protein
VSGANRSPNSVRPSLKRFPLFKTLIAPLMDNSLTFVYAYFLNAARLQEEQGILPREFMSCVKRISSVFNPFVHGTSGHFICTSHKHRRLLISFVQVGLRVVITNAKVIRQAGQQVFPPYRTAA